MIMQWLNTLGRAKYLGLVIGIFLLLDVISFLGWQWPLLGGLAALSLTIGWLLIARCDIALATILLVAELVVGSFGHLLNLTFGNSEIPLRLMLYVSAFGIMIFRIITNRRHIIFRHAWRWWFVLALASIIWGLGRGYYNWNAYAYIILDSNGYLYLLLLPLFLDAYFSAGRDRILYYVTSVLVPAVSWLCLRTLSLLYLFTHLSAVQLAQVYKWYRDTGLGEITPTGTGFFRVFSQSHLFVALAAALGFAWVWQWLQQQKKIPWQQPIFYFYLFALAALLASLSRSLWLGVVVAWILVPLLSAGTGKLRHLFRYAVTTLLLVTAAAGMVLMISRVNWPLKSLGAASAQAFSDRFGREPAAQARLQMIKPLIKAIERAPLLGSGFGSTLIYVSTDPRAVNSTAGGSGLVITYALELGYLDFWYKLGLLGSAAFGAWLIYPWLRGLRKWRLNQAAGAGVFALTAIYITHLTTPYLNHPLGLGAVLALGTFILAGDD